MSIFSLEAKRNLGLPGSHQCVRGLRTTVLEHPSAGSSFLASGPANFFSSSLSIPALFFLLPLFLAQLHFFIMCVHCIRSILPHIHISNASRRFFSFRRSAQVSAPYNATLHTKHFTSLFLTSFSKGPQKILLLLLKASFTISILYFLTAVHVAPDITPQVLKLSTYSTDLDVYLSSGVEIVFSQMG